MPQRATKILTTISTDDSSHELAIRRYVTGRMATCGKHERVVVVSREANRLFLTAGHDGLFPNTDPGSTPPADEWPLLQHRVVEMLSKPGAMRFWSAPDVAADVSPTELAGLGIAAGGSDVTELVLADHAAARQPMDRAALVALADLHACDITIGHVTP